MLKRLIFGRAKSEQLVTTSLESTVEVLAVNPPTLESSTAVGEYVKNTEIEGALVFLHKPKKRHGNLKVHRTVLLSCPPEILDLIVRIAFATSGEDAFALFRSLSRVCNLLRVFACRIYFRQEKIVSPMPPRMVTIDRALPLCVVAAVTNFEELQQQRELHLHCNLFHLTWLPACMRALLEECKVTFLQVDAGCCHYNHIADSSALLLLLDALGSSSTPCIDLVFEFRCEHGTDAEPKAPSSGSLTALHATDPTIRRNAERAMDKVVSIKFRCKQLFTPLLRDVYPLFLRGNLVVHAELCFHSQDVATDVLRFTHFPALRHLFVVTSDAASIILPLNFIRNHQQLEKCILLNDIRYYATMESSDASKLSLSLPESVKNLTICNNYSSLDLEPTTRLSLLSIEPLIGTLDDPEDPFYCDFLSGLLRLLLSSTRIEFGAAGKFTLSITLPAGIAQHAELRRSTTLDHEHCTCMVDHFDGGITNVETIMLWFDNFTEDVFELLRDFLKCFPKVETLIVAPEHVEWQVTAADLASFSKSLRFYIRHSLPGDRSKEDTWIRDPYCTTHWIRQQDWKKYENDTLDSIQQARSTYSTYTAETIM